MSTLRWAPLALLLVPAASLRVPKPLVRTGNDAIWLLNCLKLRSAGCRLGTDLELKQSGSKGQGLFAARSIEEGSLIGRYNGELLSEDEYDAKLLEMVSGQGMYVMDMGNGYILDGENPKKSTFLRYINHSVRRANCRAEEVVDTDYSGPFAAVAVVAERDIAKGEELMFDYGEAYWDELGVARFSPQRLLIDYG